MRIQQVLAGLSVVVLFTVLTGAARRGHLDDQESPKTQFDSCQAAMPEIVRQYNNAKYAIVLAHNSGDRGHILSAVNAAQAALDSMAQPLAVCSDLMNKGVKPRNNKPSGDSDSNPQ